MKDQKSKYSFDEKNHVHTYDGKRLHGVTTVLKMWGDPNPLLNWGVKTAVDYIEKESKKDGDFSVLLKEARTAHLKKRDKAGDIGTQVHKELEECMEAWIAGNVVKHMNPTVQSVVDWMQSEGITPLESEAHLYSEELWLGGIVDLIAEKDGKKYIMDFKTSNTVQTKMFYQMGAYSLMWKENNPEDVDGVCIIHIPKGKKFSPEKGVYWRYDVVELEEAFKNILKTYKLDQNLQKLTNSYPTKTSIKI